MPKIKTTQFTALFFTVAYCELTNIDTRDLDVVEISLVTLVAGC